jgi:hypothetical protein
MTEQSTSSASGIARFLVDLRSYSERRSWQDRRGQAQIVPVERRSGVDRRMQTDRRRRWLSNYSPEASVRIHRMVSHPTARVACPECDGALMLGPPVDRGGVRVRRVHCTSCRLSTEVRNLG